MAEEKKGFCVGPSGLIVDHDDINYALLEHVFGEETFVLRRARDGNEGLRILKEIDRCDVIIVNRTPHSSNDVEFLRQLRAAAPYVGIPVLVETSSNNPRALMEAMQAGACCCYTKPYDPGVLVKTVLRITNRENADASSGKLSDTTAQP